MKLPMLSTGARPADSPRLATGVGIQPLGDFQLCYPDQGSMTLALLNLSVQICPGGKVTSTGLERNGWCIHWHCP
jgi:hypothetical protein